MIHEGYCIEDGRIKPVSQWETPGLDYEPCTWFDDMNDAFDYVELVTGYSDDFDYRAIAHEVTDTLGGKLYLSVTGEDFWNVVRKHDRSVAVGC